MAELAGITRPPVLVLLAGITLTTVLGSIHAFSVFLEPLESLLQAGRAQVSLIYSGALVCLTVSVLLGHRIFVLLPPALLAFAACGSAAIGVAIAGYSQNYWLTLLGYGVIFGAANGVGYGFALQISAQAMPKRRGFAMGTVTACYALGATLAPFVFSTALVRGGLPQAMMTAGVIFLAAGIVASELLRRSGMRFVWKRRSTAPESDRRRGLQQLLWLGYGSGSLAGLMVIGHATGIVLAAGGALQLAIAGAMIIAFGNMLGGVAAGVLADRYRVAVLLAALPLVSIVGLALVAAGVGAAAVLSGLVITGFSYGAIIAAYPVAVITLFGSDSSARIYGRVFTAWGLAGVAGPWLAGSLFDATGAYQGALLVAIATSLVSTTVAVVVARR